MTVSVWILGDQLSQNHPALELADQVNGRSQVVVLMIESEARARRLPYQRKKLGLLFSAMRHYAEELRAAGYEVDYRISPSTRTAIHEHMEMSQPGALFTMAASEYRGRQYQQGLSRSLGIPINIVCISLHYLSYSVL